MGAEAIIIAGMFELAKLSLAAYFQYMRLAGKTPEEIEVIYTQAKADFEARKPADLPDV
jgi:glycogen debranching enzyme